MINISSILTSRTRWSAD